PWSFPSVCRRGSSSVIRLFRRRVRGAFPGSNSGLPPSHWANRHCAGKCRRLRACRSRRRSAIFPPVASPRELLRSIRDELGQIFLERDELIDGALVALLAAQHVLVIGPPGTAKSMLADEVCRRLTGARYFQWLLTRFTTPEELFGAVSLKALEQDDYRRLTTHKLPEAHIAFLDEIFKASSSILNTILTVMNERRFHNGREVTEVPLLTLFAASNELPEDAYLEGRTAVADEDVPFLEHVLWRDPAERPQVRSTIRELLQGYEDEVRVLLYQSRELREYALRSWDTSELRTRAAVEAHT